MASGASGSPSFEHRLWQQDNTSYPFDMPTIRPAAISILMRAQYIIQRYTQPGYGFRNMSLGYMKLLDYYLMVDLSEKTKTVHVEEFNNEESLRFQLSPCLDHFGVPEHYQNDILLPAISNFGKLMATDPRNSTMVLNMGVEIDILTTQQQNEDEAAAISRAVSRRKELAYLNDLEKVRVKQENLSLFSDCAICMEKPVLGVQFARLPCSHMYHWDCIVSWLNRSKLCPLCRHPLQKR